MKHQNSKKNNYKKWLGLINIPVQMGVIVYLFSFFGKWLDGKYPNPNNVFVKVLTLTGVAIAFYNVIQQVNKLNDDEK